MAQKPSVYLQCYPDFIQSVEKNTLIWKDGTKMIFDDREKKTYEKMIDSADLQDQLFQKYPLLKAFRTPALNEDPGRIRNEAFFRKMYGSTKEEVEKNLTEIIWLPKNVNIKLKITRINGVAEKLQKISDELDNREDLLPYLVNSGGTFNWRPIAETNRLSTHSFGIAIDINVSKSDYWLWDTKGKKDVLPVYKNRIPLEIVEIFEKYGFIWGGKWFHYDTMHFEYRPELLR